MDANGINNDLASFQQTQSTRVKDTGTPVNANPPPPPPPSEQPTQDQTSPFPFRGQNLNTSA